MDAAASSILLLDKSVQVEREQVSQSSACRRVGLTFHVATPELPGHTGDWFIARYSSARSRLCRLCPMGRLRYLSIQVIIIHAKADYFAPIVATKIIRLPLFADPI